jgi:inner membrane protein
MDNLSHSVVGLAAGELVHRSLAPEPEIGHHRLRRQLLLVSCWLASNFPDLDLVLTPLLPEPLGYLLHHRGHTHTLLYALPQALLLWAMILLLWPAARRLLQQSATARAGLFLTLCLGFGLHLLMDYLNSYGLHPFHPFDSRWFYGDMVFIVEPFFWVAFGVPMLMTVKHPALKILLSALLAGILLFFTIREFLSWASFVFLVLLGAALGGTRHKAGTSALILAVLVSIGFVGARNALLQSVKTENRGNRMLDASLSSFPANPLCWAFVSIESNENAGTYLLRRGILSLAPEVMPVGACPAAFTGEPTQWEATPALALLQQQQGRLDRLRELKKENCHFEAWLRFARAPSVDRSQAFDMRFASGPRGNFTTMHFDDFRHRACPRYIPGWNFPRADLLTAPQHFRPVK